MADYGERVADNAISATEKKLRKIYEQASKELRGKLVGFNEKFAKKQAEMRTRLEAGEITKEAYESWLRGQVFIGRQWAQKADQASRMMTDANKEAAQLVRQGSLNVFAENYNYTAYELDKQAGAFLNFNLYNTESVEKLVRKKPQMLPEWKIDEKKDYKWNRQKVENAITQGIIQGKRIDEITKDLVDKLCTTNNNKMRMFSRTAMTGAQNAGRKAQMEDAEEQGIKVKKRWLATLDNRTRDAHQELDGQTVPVKEPFKVNWEGETYELDYPGDPSGEPCMVFNCRCTMIEIYDGIDRKSVRRDMDNQLVEDMTYKEWKAMKEGVEQEPTALEAKIEEAIEKPAEIPAEIQGYIQTANVVEGRELIDTYERRPNEFQFEINDAINAQGFDGKPSVATQEEFDKAVQESGFIAQRTYSAPDQETLEAYREQLYNGEWYVDCSTGGAQYGQGMYCAADYTGTLSDGIKEEMEHYISLNDRRARDNALSEAYGKIKKSDLNLKYKITDEQVTAYAHYLQTNPIMPSIYDLSPEDREVLKTLGIRQKENLRSAMIHKANEMIGDVHAYSYTETITLKPGAKILTIYNDDDAINYLAEEYAMRHLKAPEEIELLKKHISIQHQIDELNSSRPTKETLQRMEELYEQRNKLTDDNPAIWGNIQKVKDRFYRKAERKDDGVVAALMGYDAINAKGHGKSGSYTVILNRTKCIFLGGAK